MQDRERILQHLSTALQPLLYVHALWLEGSIPQGFADEYSDLDIWLSVDDDKLFSVYEDVEKILTDIGKLDLMREVKASGDLGHRVYHIEDMSEFLTIDINTQKFSRQVVLTKGIDDARVLFDKVGIVQFMERSLTPIDMATERQKLRELYGQIALNVRKNIKREKPLEAAGYYQQLIDAIIKFLRYQHGWPEKADFGLKHVYRDLPSDDVAKLEKLFFIEPKDIEAKLHELEEWVQAL